MGIQTNIEYCDSTANPVWGCDGCELWRPKKRIFRCYAGNILERCGERFTNVRYFQNRVAAALAWSDLTGSRRPAKPWLDGLPRIVFWCDMSDAFTASAPAWVAEHEAAMRRSPFVHILLTKRPSAMVRWLASAEPLPETWWLGTSVTSNAMRPRITHLLKARDRHPEAKFVVSVEPAWGLVDLEAWLPDLDWIVWGGESGLNAVRSSWDWARHLRDQAAVASVPFFVKQGGSRLATKSAKGGRLDELPADLRIRQMPMESIVPEQGELF